MTSRAAFVLFVAALVLTGCRKGSGTNAIPGTGSGPPPAPTSAATAGNDYRTMTIPQLEGLIRDKSGSPVTLTAAGPNKYTGTRPSPDGTAQLQVTVTVEAERIVIETRGGGLSSTDTITPRGFEAGNPR
jgi:hypothetical protein